MTCMSSAKFKFTKNLQSLRLRNKQVSPITIIVVVVAVGLKNTSPEPLAQIQINYPSLNFRFNQMHLHDP